MSTFQPVVRNIEIADLPRVLEINNANTPGVSELTFAELELDLNNSLHALAIDNEQGEVCAFCITFDPSAPDAGDNHRWFAERYKSFVYLLCCEVNLEPPNPGSLRFHQHIGFTEVGQSIPEYANYRVSYLSKSISES